MRESSGQSMYAVVGIVPRTTCAACTNDQLYGNPVSVFGRGWGTSAQVEHRHGGFEQQSLGGRSELDCKKCMDASDLEHQNLDEGNVKSDGAVAVRL